MPRLTVTSDAAHRLCAVMESALQGLSAVLASSNGDVPASILSRRALCIEQVPGRPLYLLALSAEEILQVADVSRISRGGEAGALIGYQRKEVRQHVAGIVEYLDGDFPLFPNAIILALPSTVRFTRSRGPNVSDGLACAGTLEISVPGGLGARPAWIVDGQQRALALSRSRRSSLPVPVSAFIADEVSIQREQFLRVNTTRPLPRGLVTELLPAVSAPLPAHLAARKLPSALCDALARDAGSPFAGLIRRPSDDASRVDAVVSDTAIVDMLQESLSGGCLFPLRDVATGETDIEAAWRLLVVWWKAVRDAFPEAWGRPPSQSRLMHGAGIRAMGRLMDRVMALADPLASDLQAFADAEIERIVPACRWTEGVWDGLGLGWRDIENTPRHVRLLSNHLIRVYLRSRLAAA